MSDEPYHNQPIESSEVSDEPNHIYEAAIVGAGPIGIELAIGLKQAGIKNLLHLEAGQVGSTIEWWGPGTQFFSSPERIEIAGVAMPSVAQTKATREEYLAYLRAVVRQFNLHIRTRTRVTKITSLENHLFEIHPVKSTHGVGGPAEAQYANLEHAKNADAKIFRAKNIILAIGDMHQPRLLNIPGENLPHVSHYLGDLHQYFRERALVVGGKNSAVEAAIRLYRLGAEVTLSYRGKEFDPKRVKYWLKPELEWLILKRRITYFPFTQVREITEQYVTLESSNHDQQKNNSEQAPQPINVSAHHVLLMTGYIQNPSLFQSLGITLLGEEQAPKFNRQTMETNIPGVFVAGTGAGGSQKHARYFIENTHIHVQRIVAALTGKDLAWTTDPDFTSLEES